MDDTESGRQYDEREVALILKKAAEIQDGSNAEVRGRMTLEEVRQIAREVGIDPRHVTDVAASLERKPSGFLGAPTTFQTSVTLDRELTDAELGELIDVVRGAAGLQGATTQGLDTVEWTGSASLGSYFLSATRRGGTTRVRLGSHRQDTAMMVIMGTGMTGLFAALAIVANAPVGELQGAALLGGVAAGTYGATRVFWRHIAAKWDARMRRLASLVRGSVAERPAPPAPVGAGTSDVSGS